MILSFTKGFKFNVIFGWISKRERYLGSFIEIGWGFVENLILKIDLVNRRRMVYSRAYSISYFGRGSPDMATEVNGDVSTLTTHDGKFD